MTVLNNILEIMRDWRNPKIVPKENAGFDILLENHRLLKELGGGYEHSPFDDDYVKRLYDCLEVAQKMICFQTAEKPLSLLQYLKYVYDNGNGRELPSIQSEVVQEEIAIKTKSLRVKWPCEPKDIANEIIREFVSDLRNNAGTVAKFIESDTPFKEDLYVKLIEVSGCVHRKTLRGGVNWCYAHPDTFERLRYVAFEPAQSDEEIYFAGRYNNHFNMIADQQYPKNSMLVGYRGKDHLDAGYFYCPYVFQMCIPIPEGTIGSDRILHRYGKRLIRTGAKYYATISWSKDEGN